MQGYDEVLYVVGAMLIFSLLSIQVNQMFIKNDQTMADGEVEYNAISLAEEHVDRIKFMKDLDFLEDYADSLSNTTLTVDTGNGDLEYYIEIDLQDETINSSANVESKHVFLTVRSEYLGPGQDATVDNNNFVKIDFIKSFPLNN